MACDEMVSLHGLFSSNSVNLWTFGDVTKSATNSLEKAGNFLYKFTNSNLQSQNRTAKASVAR